MADAVHEQRLNMAVKPNTAMLRVQEVASVPVVATIEVGTVTTGEPGTDASVTNSGTKKEAILDFVIPRGATGIAGDDGTDGATFTPAVSADGVISWTNDGGKDNPAPVSIKGPQGIQGVPGDDYVLTDADKQEIADAVIADGTEATLGSSAADLSLGLTGAAVGQIAKITAVDENGKPTAWSPVDMPNGGSGKEWQKIIDVEISESTMFFEATGLNDVTEVYCEWGGLKTASETRPRNLDLYINDIDVGVGWVENSASNGQAMYGYSISTYTGLVWYNTKSAGIAGAGNAHNTSIGNNAKISYGLTHGVGAATKVKIKAVNADNAPVTGKLEVWAR